MSGERKKKERKKKQSWSQKTLFLTSPQIQTISNFDKRFSASCLEGRDLSETAINQPLKWLEDYILRAPKLATIV